jgi:hypothetical protein
MQRNGSEDSLENENFPGFRACARSGLEYFSIFRDEKLVLVILPQILLRDVDFFLSLQFLPQSTCTFQIFGRPGPLQWPKTSFGQILDRQKAFFHQH